MDREVQSLVILKYSPTLKNIFWNTNVRKQNYNNVSESDIVSCLVAIPVYGALPGSQYQLLIRIIMATLGGVNKVSSSWYQIHFISCKELIQNTKFHILDYFDITSLKSLRLRKLLD